jgi:hypothetical protein
MEVYQYHIMAAMVALVNYKSEQGLHLGNTKKTSREAQDRSAPKKLGMPRYKFRSVCTHRRN